MSIPPTPSADPRPPVHRRSTESFQRLVRLEQSSCLITRISSQFLGNDGAACLPQRSTRCCPVLSVDSRARTRWNRANKPGPAGASRRATCCVAIGSGLSSFLPHCTLPAPPPRIVQAVTVESEFGVDDQILQAIHREAAAISTAGSAVRRAPQKPDRVRPLAPASPSGEGVVRNDHSIAHEGILQQSPRGREHGRPLQFHARGRTRVHLAPVEREQLDVRVAGQQRLQPLDQAAEQFLVPRRFEQQQLGAEQQKHRLDLILQQQLLEMLLRRHGPARLGARGELARSTAASDRMAGGPAPTRRARCRR